LPWYQWMQSWRRYLTWSLCTWGVQVRPPTPVWNKHNSVAKRNAPSLLLCCFKFADPVVKQAICIKLTVPLGEYTLRYNCPFAVYGDLQNSRRIGSLSGYLVAWWRWAVVFMLAGLSLGKEPPVSMK
jgi:hypothetical protein